jgi:hypothetical protein
MSNKAQRLFYAIVVSISLLVGVIATGAQSSFACGAGGCGGGQGTLSATTLK